MDNLNYFGISDVELLYSVSLLLGVISLLLFTLVMFSRKNKNIRNRVRNGILVKCQDFISELVFEESLSPKAKELEVYLLSTVYKRQILIGEIINLRKSLKGELARFLEDYFIRKSLYKISLSKVKSSRKYQIIEGLVELSEMNAMVTVSSVKEIFLKQRSTEMKIHFLEFFVRQSSKDGLDELLKTPIYLSDWFQIKIINILKGGNFIQVPTLESWLKIGGSHSFFGCRLVAYARVYEDIPTLVEILTSDNDTLKIEALKTLVVLEAKESSEELITQFLLQTDIVKKEILTTLAHFKLETHVAFFLKCQASESEEIRLHAESIINKFKQGTNLLG